MSPLQLRQQRRFVVGLNTLPFANQVIYWAAAEALLDPEPPTQLTRLQTRIDCLKLIAPVALTLANNTKD